MGNSISKKIGLIVAIVLVVIMSLMMILLQSTMEKREMATAEENIHDAATYVTKSLMFIMAQGVDDVEPYIKDVQNVGNTQEIRVVPSNLVIEDSENTMDAEELSVLTSKEQSVISETFQDEPVIRFIVPIIATENCLDCHDGNTGDSYGTISVRTSILNVKKSITSQARILTLVSVFTIFITCLVIILLLKRQVLRGLLQITAYLEKFSKGNIEADICVNGDCEIGAAGDSLKVLQQSLLAKAANAEQIARGDLSREINVQSDQDILGKAMVSMKERISALVDDANNLASSAVNGDLQTRADESRHEGEFAKIVENFNKTLDAVIGPINDAAQVMERISNKDLTVQMNGLYKGDYEKIKIALNTAVNNLDDGLYNIIRKTESVATASRQIDSTNQAVAQGATEQAGTLQEIGSKLQELTASSTENASHANEAISISESSFSTTRKGQESMKKLSDAIESIKSSSDQTTAIVKNIDEIAFQTNLLALNAAVEAARAGEAGKGFAVVAEEVRNLAIRSAEAAKDTAELVSESVKNAEDGVQLNIQVSSDLKEIAEQIQKANDVVKLIAVASIEHNRGIEQINDAVEQLNKVTQDNAANSEESAAAASEMASDIQEMKALVEEYQISNK